MDVLKEMKQLILEQNADNKVSCRKDIFKFSVGVWQSFSFEGTFDLAADRYNVQVSVSFEDYVDMFGLDDDDYDCEDVEFEDEYDEFINASDCTYSTLAQALSKLSDLAIDINKKTGYINDDIIELFSKCRQLLTKES